MKTTLRNLVAIALLAIGTVVGAQQQTKVWRLGLFHVGLDHVPGSLTTFRERLKALGYEQGKNIQLDWRNLPDEEAASATAQEFVRNRVDLIVAFENQTVRAAKLATAEIPVVFLHVTDPVADGYVKSLARPGGNLTGFIGLGEVPGKQLELFKEILPGLRRVLVIIDPQDPTTGRIVAEIRKVGGVLKLQLMEHKVTGQTEIERVFSSIKRGDVDGGLIASPDLQQKFTYLVLDLATEKRIPMVVRRGTFLEKAGLFSYGHNPLPVGRDAAQY
jgi:putative ABC transport system substrate-binding protein